MRRVPASALLLAILALNGCGRGSEAIERFTSNGGDVGDTTLHFSRLDTTLLTNGSGWVRKEPGVTPDLGAPQQLQAPQSVDSAFMRADSELAPGASDSSASVPSRRRDTIRDTLRDTLAAPPDLPRSRPRRDSTPPRARAVHPDTTVPDSTE